jgi:hypothetical protein
MWKSCLVLLLAAASALAETGDEWEQFRKTGLFPEGSTLWLVPDMAKESMSDFTSRLLDGARQGDAKAMATLGRFFFLRGDLGRAVEWLGKAAEAGHSGAQFDFGTLCAQGKGVPVDLVEGYKWLWLATWEQVPGADAALRELSGKVAAWQVLMGVRRATEFQDKQRKAGVGPAGVQLLRSSSSK